MSFELLQLRYAVVAAEERSFARAARRLRVKQSTLSRRILLMEQRLGVTLFERSTRGAMPTRAGLDFFEIARRILDDADLLHRKARSVHAGVAGHLVIGFNTSLSAGNLRAAIQAFMIRFPEVELIGVEAGFDVLARGLSVRAIDVAIIPGQLAGEGFDHRHLWPERLMVALPEEHPLAPAERIYWSDLRDATFVLPKHDPGPFVADLIRARLNGAVGGPSIVMQDISRENILNFLPVAGYISLVAETAAGTHHPGVVLREIHDLAGLTHVDFWAWRHPQNDNAALDSFLRLVGERYPGGLGSK